ncbi:MAG: prealbumin-like fold domain-containing protein [Bifidobacterium subtile]|jgi:LPXTG-motif cell wall-anchored protein|nr:prealbumin-like fold domain-containing protein [Bifidobacterium subtile]MCI1241458.1 prealbumin-like fold domain-containing protein [Bifidobacterium subtile]MCI1258456.1 prealbumin-like fold domain-containing protein [Bifidobacterium subtile]
MRKPAQEGRRRSTFARLVFSILAAIAMLATGGIVAAVHAPVAQAATGPDGASAPYVYWTVKDASGALVPSATFTIQGPRTSTRNWKGESNVRWNSPVTVADCVQGPCAGPDLDPDPGEFLVKQIGSHSISSSNRYRVRQISAPTGYTFTDTSNSWNTIPGTYNTPSGWSGSGTYNFGNFAVQNIPAQSPICDAGVVYGIRGNGQIVQVKDGAVTKLGSAADSNSGFNGLGIGPAGSPVYAYARGGDNASDNRPRMFKYNTTTGVWESTTHRIAYDNNSQGISAFVAGGIDLKTKTYYMGTFSSDGKQFRIWQYDGNSNPVFKGYIDTSENSGGHNNGDLAFNANGDMFVVRGSGKKTTVFSVTAEDLAGNVTAPIPSSYSTTVDTMDSVNGVAFDASGKAYLGANDVLRSYDMPDWSNGNTLVPGGLGKPSLSGSNDLASCSSPATITVEKYVQGGRVNDSDQFTLSLIQDSKPLGTATTTGSQPGLQKEHIGPQPTARGVTLNFSEVKASGTTTDLSKYASSWSCRVDDEPIPGAAGTGMNGSVKIPSTGDSVVCRFTNAPLVANVEITKLVRNEPGADPQPDSGWTVKSSAQPTAGSVTPNPTAVTQATDTSGSAKWNLNFGTTNSRATVNVSENEKSKLNYAFSEGQCLITSLDGDVRSQDLSGPQATALTGIAPGDDVQCSYVNEKQQASLTVTKVVTNKFGGTAKPDDFKLTTTLLGGSSVGVKSGVRQTVAPGTYVIGETLLPGYEQDGAVSCKAGDNKLTVTNNAVNVGNGQDVTCTLVNKDKPGSVSWSKTDEGDHFLSGSEWTLTPTDPAGAAIPVTDNTGQSGYSGLDTNTAAGKFTVGALKWGKYELQETKAPAGYVLPGTKYPFEIKATGLTATVNGGDAIKNEQATPPNLPLTGGLSTDAFLIGGSSLIIVSAGVWLALRRRSRAEA